MRCSRSLLSRIITRLSVIYKLILRSFNSNKARLYKRSCVWDFHVMMISVVTEHWQFLCYYEKKPLGSFFVHKSVLWIASQQGSTDAAFTLFLLEASNRPVSRTSEDVDLVWKWLLDKLFPQYFRFHWS